MQTDGDGASSPASSDRIAAGAQPATVAGEVLASVNLASARRTVSGVVDQLKIVGMGDDEIVAGFRRVGLPARARDEPEFPVSRDQELTLLAELVTRLRARLAELQLDSVLQFALRTFSGVGVNHYGVLGLAAQHASSMAEAIRVFLEFPELSWGHTRIVARRDARELTLTFEMGAELAGLGPPVAADLAAYCVGRDLASVTRLLADIGGDASLPTRVEMPGRGGAAADTSVFGCPLVFDAPEARVCYPQSVADLAPLLANALVFTRYVRIARGASRLLAEDAPLAERVARLLWAYEPPPDRAQVADMLAVGERTLARRLRAEGSSYQGLLNRVQSERAASYLLHTHQSIASISERLGYADPAAFSRAFQGWYGQPPSRWRASRAGR